MKLLTGVRTMHEGAISHPRVALHRASAVGQFSRCAGVVYECAYEADPCSSTRLSPTTQIRHSSTLLVPS